MATSSSVIFFRNNLQTTGCNSSYWHAAKFLSCSYVSGEMKTGLEKATFYKVTCRQSGLLSAISYGYLSILNTVNRNVTWDLWLLVFFFIASHQWLKTITLCFVKPLMNHIRVPNKCLLRPGWTQQRSDGEICGIGLFHYLKAEH